MLFVCACMCAVARCSCRVRAVWGKDSLVNVGDVLKFSHPLLPAPPPSYRNMSGSESSEEGRPPLVVDNGSGTCVCRPWGAVLLPTWGGVHDFAFGPSALTLWFPPRFPHRYGEGRLRW